MSEYISPQSFKQTKKITMDIAFSEKVLPSTNIVQTINSQMPHLIKQLQIDGSIETKERFIVNKEPSDLRSKSPITFIVHQTPGYFLDLKSFYLEIDIVLQNINFLRAGVNDAKAYFINNLGQSMWSAIKVFLNDVSVQSGFHSSQISNLIQILTTTNLAVTNFGALQGAFPTTDTSVPNAITDGHLATDEIKKRIAYAKTNPIKLRVPLNLDISSADKLLVDGVNMKLVLHPASAPYMINSDTPYEYSIKDIKLGMTKIKPTDPALITCNKYLMGKEIEYLIRRTPVHEEIMSAGISEFSINRPFNGWVPNQIILWMVEQKAINGDYKLTPFRLNHYNLLQYSIKVNGNEVAGSMVDKSLISVYHESYKSFDSDYFVPFQNYVNGSFVIVSNCTHQSDENSINIDRRGNLSISLRFRENLPDNVKVFVMGTIDSTISIDNDRIITTNYQF